jgi:hypothetical protein
VLFSGKKDYMAKLNISKVTELPVTIMPSTMYLLPSTNINRPDDLKLIVSNLDGTSLKSLLNYEDVVAYVDAAILAGSSNTYMVGVGWTNNEVLLDPLEVDMPTTVCKSTGVIKSIIVLTEGGPGSLSMDIWKSTIDNYPPVITDTILAGNEVVITSGYKLKDITLSGWNKNITAGDILRFKLNQNTNFTSIRIFVEIMT